MTDLSALIARLEAGPVYLTHKEAYDLAIFFGSDTALGMSSMIRKAFVGGSLDAALALAERVLGGWAWQVDRWGAMSRITLNECDNDGWHRSKHQRIEVAIELPPALALCIAILRAKQGEGE